MKDIIVLLGPLGSGKGTQSELLSNETGFMSLSTGSLLRKEAEKNTKLGREIAEVINNGNLVSDELIFEILIKKLNDNKNAKGFILDGFPRTRKQAEMLSGYLDKSKDFIIRKAFLISLDKGHILERICNRLTCKSCGAIYNGSTKKPKVDGVCDLCQSSGLVDRKDDLNMKAINKRIDIFKANIDDIASFYEKKSLIFSIDGLKDVRDINCEMIKALNSDNVINK